MSDANTTEHRRLAILRHLERSPDYTANTSILLDIVRGVGVGTSTDQMTTALAWLEEQELLRLTPLDTVTIATITARGCEVAQGMVVHPGVKRPRPRA